MFNSFKGKINQSFFNENRYASQVTKKMVVEVGLKGMPGKRGLMFVSYYGRSRAFISNYQLYFKLYQIYMDYEAFLKHAFESSYELCHMALKDVLSLGLTTN